MTLQANSWAILAIYLFIGPAVLSSDKTSAYVLYFPTPTIPTACPPPIFPNCTNYQILPNIFKLAVQKPENMYESIS